MKTIIVTLLLFIAGVPAAVAQFLQADVGVNGLTCSMCAKGTEASLRQLPFIDSINIDLNNLVAHITFKKDASVSIDEIKKMVEDAGFSVRSISAIFQFDNVSVSKDTHFAFGGDTYHFVGVGEKKLSGPVTLKFVDKPYVSKREFTELSKKTDLQCYKKGASASCCEGEHAAHGHLYHVTL